MQQSDKAKMYFNLAIEFYPKSTNAYDSLADYYEAQNDIPSALIFVQKASELSDNVYYKNRIQLIKNK